MKALKIFPLFWLIAFLLYRSTAGAGFVTDHIGWLNQYAAQGSAGLADAYGDKALHYVYHLAGYVVWKLFGFNGEAWMITFTALHAMVASIGYIFLNALFDREKIERASLTAFFGALMFLCSPYATEVVVWYACLHYLICSVLLLLSMYFFLKYAYSNKTQFLWLFYLLFVIALFTLEISFAFPFMISALLLFSSGIKNKQSLFFKGIVPLFGGLALYFGVSYFLRDSVVGHYGAATHLQLNPLMLASNLMKYSFKILAYTQSLSYENRDSLYAFFDKKYFAALIIVVGGIKLLIAILWRSKFTSSVNLSVLLFSIFACALLPVLNLYFTHLVDVEGDRLSYFASLFAYAFLALAFTDLFGMFSIPVILFFLFFFQLPLLQKNILAWTQNAVVHRQLIENFPKSLSDTVIVLSSPDNYRGTYMMRDETAGNILETELRLCQTIGTNQTVIQVLGFNMQQQSDAVKVERQTNGEIKVWFAQYGNWWWMRGIGAADHENDIYTVRMGKWNDYYLRFKSNANCDILYTTGSQWRKLN